MQTTSATCLRHGRPLGFTLIELLIVVAIIAILAAIAVPNFLEAQTRSKISRARADMRTAATAIEAYFTDHNKYPMFNALGGGQRNRGFIHDLVELSTPVAYIASVELVDPFNKGQDTPRPNYPDSKYYSFWYANTNGHRAEMRLPPLSYPLWHVFSYGPDYIWSGPMDSLGYSGHAHKGVDKLIVYEYDASNGTRSAGDIHRWP